MIASAQLFRGQELDGALPELVAGVSRDSRTLRAGEVFVAQGRDDERAQHIAQARQRGAAAVITPRGDARGDARTADVRFCFARACAALHGTDRLAFPVVAATGTKGKTTIVHLAHGCLGPGAARLGTVSLHDGIRETPSPQTTPAPEVLHAFIAALPRSCPGVALEASSHAADQQRLAGLTLRALVVSNIGHDHLDYHRTHAAYVAAKMQLVELLTAQSLLIVNAQDAFAEQFAGAARVRGARVTRLGFSDCDEWISTSAQDGWTLSGAELAVALPGSFNAWNAAAAVLLAEAAGVARATALQRLRHAAPPPGRCERLAEAPATYVDYAHTPESVAAVIAAIRAQHPGALLAMVLGCGGDRDRAKRAPMGAAAAQADLVVITSDNCRSEDPQQIAAMMRAGMPSGTTVIEEPDRGAAIRTARSRVGAQGAVIVAGKGHETEQIIGARTVPWDDRAFVRALMEQS